MHFMHISTPAPFLVRHRKQSVESIAGYLLALPKVVCRVSQRVIQVPTGPSGDACPRSVLLDLAMAQWAKVTSQVVDH